MHRSTLSLLLLAPLALSAPSLLSAQPLPRWYLGAGLGQGEAEVIGHDRSQQVFQQLSAAGFQPGNIMGSEQDDTDSWKLYGGYRFTPWLAAELSYHDLGHTTGLFAANLNGSASLTQGRLRSEYQAVAAAMVGQWQVIKPLALFVKGGLHHWQHQFELKGEQVNINHTDSGNGYLYGAGVQFSLWQAASLKVEWERLADIEDEDGLDVKTLSLEWAF